MTQKFHERFKISVSTEEAKQRFVNRVYNEIFTRFYFGLPGVIREEMERSLLTILGLRQDYDAPSALLAYVKHEFWNNVQAVEALYKVAFAMGYGPPLRDSIQGILNLSECDIGIRWHDGHFLPSGSPVLDEKLVNEVLGCLADEKYSGVKVAFEKGLHHFLQSIGKPQFHSDVVTEMYEALEALAKVFCGDKDLSKNAEKFLSLIKAPDEYKPILKAYIAYGNTVRHAGKDGQPKANLTRKEIESFVYMTGLFIRFAILEESLA